MILKVKWFMEPWGWRLEAWRIRTAERAWCWLARRAPAGLRYWIVINEASAVSCDEPHVEVPSITWDQMAQRIGRDR